MMEISYGVGLWLDVRSLLTAGSNLLTVRIKISAILFMKIFIKLNSSVDLYSREI